MPSLRDFDSELHRLPVTYVTGYTMSLLSELRRLSIACGQRRPTFGLNDAASVHF